jgi:hypothetical protein
MPHAKRPRTRSVRGSGFTLIEAALATVIVGVGVLAMVDAQQAFIKTNTWSSHAASGTFLANEIREMTRNLPKHDPVVGLSLDDGGVLTGWGPNAAEFGLEDFDDLDDFDGITFSYVGTAGFEDGDLPGPVNAFREVVPQIDAAGSIVTDGGVEVPMFGWRQTVIVEKVDPFDTSISLDDDYVEPPSGSFKGLDVDQFPLRVTVVVTYQRSGAAEPEEVARVTWIRP